MAKIHNKSNVYKVRFKGREETKVSEVTVRSVTSSDIMGCVVLEGFILKQQSKHLIVPNEEDALSKYKDVKKLHIPFHNILEIEEICIGKEKPQALSIINHSLKNDNA